jgi:hypothetical protein
MSLRAPRETIESLRLTLATLEQSADPSGDAQVIAELKRILLARIADLEAVTAVDTQAEVSTPPDEPPATPVSPVPPIKAVAGEESNQAAIGTAQSEARAAPRRLADPSD